MLTGKVTGVADDNLGRMRQLSPRSGQGIGDATYGASGLKLVKGRSHDGVL